MGSKSHGFTMLNYFLFQWLLLWAGLKPTTIFWCINFVKSSALCSLQVKPSLEGQHPKIPFQQWLCCYVKHHIPCAFPFSSAWLKESPTVRVREPFSLMTAPTVIRGEGLRLQWLQCSTAWLKYGFSWHQDRHRDILNFIGYCATGVCLRDPFPFLPAPGQQCSLLQQRPQTQPKSNPRDPKNLLY